MKRKNEIYINWQIQETLLQNYRIMAITLLGLISAGVLVIITYLLQDYRNFTLEGDTHWLKGILLALYGTLLLLGALGTVHFRTITDARAKNVTFMQNLLLAEESGQLDALLLRYNMHNSLKFLHLLRRMRGNVETLPLESDKSEDWQCFIRTVSLADAKKEQKKYRHHFTRQFLSSFIYNVFIFFFIFAASIWVISIANYFSYL